jgi:hypothetical protein
MNYDCHVTVFDPARWQPVERRVNAQAATVGDLQAFLSRRMFNAVVVQSPAYRGMHGCLIDALRTLGPNVRAVAQLCRHTPAEEVRELHSAGARGTRWLVVDECIESAVQELDALHDMLPAQWHIELAGSRSALARLAPVLAHWPRRFVAVADRAWDGPCAHRDAEPLLWWMEMGNLYLKLVLPRPVSQPLLAQAIQRAPDRLLWGSGWPDAGPAGVDPAFASQKMAATLDRNARSLYEYG